MDDRNDPFRPPTGLDGRGPRGPRSNAGGRAVPPTNPLSGRLGVVMGIVIVVLLFGAGVLEFWTDAIWYRSVQFDAVFWTRVWATLILFVVGAGATLLILLGNLWLANRFAPPGDGTPASFGDVLQRLSEVSAAGDPRDRMGMPRPINAEPIPMPDLSPLATVVLAGLSVLAALIIGGAAAASWDTILLWIHRVPFVAAGGAPSVDPIFGRNVAWFLFDLPFLRTVQTVFNIVVLGAIGVAGARYLAGMSRSGFSLPSAVRIHLAVLAGLYLAVGRRRLPARQVRTGVHGPRCRRRRQLHGPARPVPGLRPPDRHLRVRRGVPRRCRVHALDLAARHHGRRLVPGVARSSARLYPEVIQRFVVLPNQYDQEERYIGNNIAMTRLAYGLDAWEERKLQRRRRR